MLNKNGKIVNLDQEAKDNINKNIVKYASDGLRTLAICVKFDVGILDGYDGPNHKAHDVLQEVDKYAELEQNPIFLGIVALEDPPRKDVILIYIF